MISRFLGQNVPLRQSEDDECSMLAKGYTTKLRKLSAEQLTFVDKLFNSALFDAQMKRLTENSFLVHPSPPCPILPSYRKKPSDALLLSESERCLWKLDEEIWSKLLELQLLVFQFIEQAYIEIYKTVCSAKQTFFGFISKVYKKMMSSQKPPPRYQCID